MEASHALNYGLWGIPAVLSRGIPGNALRPFPQSFRNFSGICFSRTKTDKEKSHKGIWWWECPGSAPEINSGRPRNTRDVWADLCGNSHKSGQNVRGTDGTDDGTDGTCPRTDGTQTRGCPAKILYVYWCFSFPIVPESPGRTGGVAHKQNETQLREPCMFCTSIVMGMHWTGLPDRNTDHIGETVSKEVSSFSLRRGFWAMFREHFGRFFRAFRSHFVIFLFSGPSNELPVTKH